MARTLALMDEPASRDTDWREVRPDPQHLAEITAIAQRLLQHDRPRVRELRNAIQLWRQTAGDDSILVLSFDQPAAARSADGYLVAKRTATLLADMVAAGERERHTARRRAALDLLRELVVEARAAMVAREQAVRDFRAKLPVAQDHGDANDELDRATARLNNVERELSDVSQLRRGIAPLLKENESDARAAHETSTSVIPATLLETDAALRYVSTRLDDLRRQELGLLSRYTLAHPEMRRVRAEIGDAQHELAQALRGSLDRLSARQTELTSQAQRERKHVDELARLMPEYRMLAQGAAAARQEYDRICELLASSAANAPETIVRLDEATTPDPDQPVRPDPFAWAGWAAAAALILSVAGLAIHERGAVTFPLSQRDAAPAELTVLGAISHHPHGLLHS